MKLFCLILILIGAIATVGECFKPSGFYFDNGHNQTAFELLSEDLQELVGEELLDLLGLSRTPAKRGRKKAKPNEEVFAQRVKDNHTIPVFMKNIYNSLTDDEGILKNLVDDDDIGIKELLSNPFHITRNGVRMINSSDIIMSFANRDLQEESKWTPLFWFDTYELPGSIDTEILTADLRIFKNPVNPIDGKPGAEFLMKVFQMAEDSTEVTRLLDTQTVRHDTEGWIVFNVSGALRQWQHEQATNQGLMLEVTEVGLDEQVHPVVLGIVTGKQTTFDKESFLVTYLRSSVDLVRERYNRIRRISGEDEDAETRVRRQARISKRKKNRRNRERSNNPNLHLLDVFKFSKNNRNLFGKHDPAAGHCQRHMLRVNFMDLNWQDWIISPSEYEKYYCKGNCLFPLSSSTHPTSHAILQAFAHSLTPELIPMPCCAPTRLSGLSVLYFDESSNVVLKKYKNMIVKNCGCQ